MGITADRSAQRHAPGPVIVGVEDSRRSSDAVALGRLLARLIGAPLLLVSVYPVDELATRLGTAWEYFEELRADADRTLERAAGSVVDVDVATQAISDHSTGRALHELAASEGASLVCVGSSRRGLIGRVLPGGTGERLLHGAPCPVAVAPRGFADNAPDRFSLIGCGFHGRPESDGVLELAASLTSSAHARLEVIAAVEPVLVTAPMVYAMSYGRVMKEHLDWMRKCVHQAVERLPADVGAESVVEEGDAIRVLSGRSHQLDLLVLGSRGYGPLHAVLMGGVSSALVRKAACPVLVMPRQSGVPLAPVPEQQLAELRS